jgi:3-hydroxymyristoyl/3-hydroxydecanoyl-(acyl carrier protein) dehydratase
MGAETDALHDGVELLRLQVDGEALDATLRVTESCPLFRGHFPGRPVLPGVGQIMLVVALCRAAGWGELNVAGLERVKFIDPVGPGALLGCVVNRRGGRLRFELHRDGATVASGTLLLSSPSR